MENLQTLNSKGLGKAGAWKFIILVGVVSLFSDMTHEGALTITGPFLGILGAGAISVHCGGVGGVPGLWRSPEKLRG